MSNLDETNPQKQDIMKCKKKYNYAQPLFILEWTHEVVKW